MRPHRQQPTRLLGPSDSPGKNTGVVCRFLLQCMKVKSGREVAQSCPTLSDLMYCSLPGSFIHGICQATVLEWGAITFSAWSIYITVNGRIFFYFISFFILYIYHIFFIHLSIDGHFGCFHVLTIINSAAVIWVHISFQVSGFAFFG